MNKEIGILILAAGSSSRMGQSKQLLPLSNNETLLSNAITISLASPASKTLVVLGHEYERHLQSIQHHPIITIVNEHWNLGIGSSIKKGIKELVIEHPTIDAAAILVCDQPHLTAKHISTMIHVYETSNSLIVASRYTGTLGVPALFDRSIFNELLKLDDQKGAKQILSHYKNIAVLDFPKGNIDLDTPQEYKDYLSDKHE